MLRGDHRSNPRGGWGSDHGQLVEAKGIRSQDVQRKCIGLENPWDAGTEREAEIGWPKVSARNDRALSTEHQMQSMRMNGPRKRWVLAWIKWQGV